MRAIVIGSKGQDGWYLCEQLEAAGGWVDRLSRQGLVRSGDGEPVPVSLEDRAAIHRLIGEGAYDQIYYLAAFHHSSQDQIDSSTDVVRLSFSTHVTGLLNVLDAMVASRSKASLVYAASSHVFGVVASGPQTEETPYAPICAYGISKAAGAQLCRLYRDDYDLRASVGLLYNHESPRRAPRFLSRKVVRATAEIVRGERKTLALGNLQARVDWGYAPEYTQAMQRIAERNVADDFIVASGRTATVCDFVAAAFAHAGLDWRRHVTVDPTIVQKVERGPLLGDATKLRRTTGWSAGTTVEALAALMVDAELRQGRDGDNHRMITATRDRVGQYRG